MIEQKGLDFKFEQKTQAKPEMIDNPPARHALPFLTLGDSGSDGCGCFM